MEQEAEQTGVQGHCPAQPCTASTPASPCSQVNMDILHMASHGYLVPPCRSWTPMGVAPLIGTSLCSIISKSAPLLNVHPDIPDQDDDAMVS